jgi:predicted DNA-binding WGR domain protein
VHNKFWIVRYAANQRWLQTCWGRIGTGGQTKTKTFPNWLAVRRETGRLVNAKRRKGYRRKHERWIKPQQLDDPSQVRSRVTMAPAGEPLKQAFQDEEKQTKVAVVAVKPKRKVKLRRS